MKLSTLAHCILPSATSTPRLLAAALVVMGLSHVPAKALLGECNPADYWCNPDGSWRWDVIVPDSVREKRGKPPSDGTERPPQYSSGEFANRSQSWYNPNYTYAPPSGFTGTRGGPTTPPPPKPFQRAEIIRTKAVKGAAGADRQDGPCFNHQLIDGLTHVPAAEAHFYMGFDLSAMADPDMSELVRTAFFAFTDYLNQFYGSQPRTSLMGPTFADQHGGVSPKWKFSVYDTLDQAKTAAAAATEKNQIVFPIQDMHNSRVGSLNSFGRSTIAIDKSGGPVIRKMEIEFELLKVYKSYLAQQYDLTDPIFTLSSKSLVLHKLLNRTLPHEFGHAVGDEHQTQEENLDDDGGPMPIAGASDVVRYDDVMSAKIRSPLSFCAGVPIAANPAP